MPVPLIPLFIGAVAGAAATYFVIRKRVHRTVDAPQSLREPIEGEFKDETTTTGNDAKDPDS